MMSTRHQTAVEWIARLDTSSIRRHLEQAALEDAADLAEAVTETYRVIGCCGRTGKCKVVREGLTEAQALEMRDRMRRDPLVSGFSVHAQSEKEALPW